MHTLTQVKISTKEFILFKDYIYDKIGISLSDKKITLLRTRLNKRLYELGLDSFTAYYSYLQDNSTEHTKLISAISTNVTYFFREKNHWLFLDENLTNILNNQNKLRIWSSACSTGEEPYTIAMFLQEYLDDLSSFDIKILATDISHEAIKKAQLGIYLKTQIDDLPSYHLNNSFVKSSQQTYLEISSKIKELITFRTFNLVYGNYNLFRNTKFNIIFCRNVLIYFDEETKNKVASNLANQLVDGGYLLIGHSESLIKHKSLKYIAPSIYQKSKV